MLCKEIQLITNYVVYKQRDNFAYISFIVVYALTMCVLTSLRKRVYRNSSESNIYKYDKYGQNAEKQINYI